MSLTLSKNQIFTITKNVQTHGKKQFSLIRTGKQTAVMETEVQNYLFLVTEAVTDGGRIRAQVRLALYCLLGHTAFQIKAFWGRGTAK